MLDMTEISKPSAEYEYEVALSFAGEDRSIAERLAGLLSAHGMRVFYDAYEPAQLWGKDLYQHLQTVYRDKAEYCVILVSRHYVEKVWTRHELRQAQARALQEQREYVLPLRIDDTELPGLNHTVGYVSLANHSLEAIADLLALKVYGPDYEIFYTDSPPPNWKGDMIIHNGVEVTSFWPRKIEAAQRRTFYWVSRKLKRIPYGQESHDWHADRLPCHDCGVVKGEYHVPSCDVEECPSCHQQAISCGCDHEPVE